MNNILKQYALSDPCSLMPPRIMDWINFNLKRFPAGSILVETGTFMAGTTQLLAKANPDFIIHSIDINDVPMWQRRNLGKNYNGLQAFLKKAQVDRNTVDLLELQKMHVEDFPNIHLHTGDGASLDVDNISVLLLDSDHSEGQILKELEHYWPRLIPGAIIFGDDFSLPPVTDSFNEFVEKHNLKMQVMWNRTCKIEKPV